MRGIHSGLAIQKVTAEEMFGNQLYRLCDELVDMSVGEKAE